MSRPGAKLRLLWGMVRNHPGGEQAMRDIVVSIHDEDGTCQELRGTDDYASTKNLTGPQFERLLDRVAEGACWPRRRRAKMYNVVFLISKAEQAYIRFLKESLGWADESFQAFAKRQTKGQGVRTHRQASAVIEPMERMLAERGWRLTERKGDKWWDPPSGDVSRAAS